MVRSGVGVGVDAPDGLDVGGDELLPVGWGNGKVQPASSTATAATAATLANTTNRPRRALAFFRVRSRPVGLTVSTPMSFPVCSFPGHDAMPRGPTTATMGIVNGAIDLNSDLGESFGAWRMGDDEAMLELVSSASIACGFHAGDASVMLASCATAARNGVSVGAHVSYRDLAGFGRRAMDVPSRGLYADVLYQLAALDGIARVAGTRVAYVKPHGALYNRIVSDEEQADAVAHAVADFDPALPMLGLAGSSISRRARERGLSFVREAFVDRGYLADGSLVPRGRPGDLLSDVAAIAARAVELVVERRVTAADGTVIDVEVDSLCVHGDTPGAVGMARAVRSALTAAGIRIEAFAP